MANIVYAVLHIPTSEYVTLRHRASEIALLDEYSAAQKLISIMTGDTSFYWGAPRVDYEIGKMSLLEYILPPDIEEFDIISMPREILSQRALEHILKMPEYTCHI